MAHSANAKTGDANHDALLDRKFQMCNCKTVSKSHLFELTLNPMIL